MQNIFKYRNLRSNCTYWTRTVATLCLNVNPEIAFTVIVSVDSLCMSSRFYRDINQIN